MNNYGYCKKHKIITTGQWKSTKMIRKSGKNKNNTINIFKCWECIENE